MVGFHLSNDSLFKLERITELRRLSGSPVNEPLDALVSRFEKEVRAEAGEEERDAGVQLLVDLLGLDAALQGRRGGTEQGALKLQECRLDSQQLLQPGASCTRKRTDRMKVREETGWNGRRGRGGRDSPRA